MKYTSLIMIMVIVIWLIVDVSDGARARGSRRRGKQRHKSSPRLIQHLTKKQREYYDHEHVSLQQILTMSKLNYS